MKALLDHALRAFLAGDYNAAIDAITDYYGGRYRGIGEPDWHTSMGVVRGDHFARSIRRSAIKAGS